MKFEDLLGKVIVEISGMFSESEEIIFKLSNGDTVILYHYRDCCEIVSVEDIVGDPADLLNSPITLAVESSSYDHPTDNIKSAESFTWTFYKLATIRGYVDIRWFGESNGYYSESVDIKVIPAKH